MQPKITCIICTFNRAELLKRAIKSVIAQEFPEWELLVVDDNSTDHTAEVVSRIQEIDRRVKYLCNPKKGLPSARNHGIAAAKGKYIAFLDDDDISLPHRFEAQYQAMRNSGCGFLVSGYQVRNAHTGAILSEHKLELKTLGAGFPSRWMVKKQLLDAIDGFDESYASMEDIECSYRLTQHGHFSQHNSIVTIMYETPGSMSTNIEANIIGREKLLEKHAAIMPPVEAAWWHYTTALDYYRLKNRKAAAIHFKKAAQLDNRQLYSIAYAFFSITGFLDRPLRRLNRKILNGLRDFRYPNEVEHPVLD